jgi:hypothetical protein
MVGGSDPRDHLEIGYIYEVGKKEVHSWHTLYYLVGFLPYAFNSVCFEEMK